jgi:uncharacterized membrane protein AbrB (regulator of aidB expression)
MFQHWAFWLVATLLVLIFLLVARERSFRDKLNGSIDGKKYWLGFNAVWLEKNFSRLIGFIAGVGLVLMVVGCSHHEPAASGMGLPDWFVNIFMFVGWLLNLVGIS